MGHSHQCEGMANHQETDVCKNIYMGIDFLKNTPVECALSPCSILYFDTSATKTAICKWQLKANFFFLPVFVLFCF